MAPQFKIKCIKCKKNYQLVDRPTQYVTCYECQKSELEGEITDPKIKELFDIPEEFYKDNVFLRDIKMKYLRFGNLSENQVAAFEKVVERMKKARASA